MQFANVFAMPSFSVLHDFRVVYSLRALSVAWLSHRELRWCTKAGQIGLLRAGHHAKTSTGCPIAEKKRNDVESVPKAGPQQGEQACEAVPPTAQMSEEAHQQVGQQRRPYLPLDRLLVVADEVDQLHGLFQLLEEHLDLPSGSVQFGNRPGTPRQVVCDKGHGNLLAVNLNDRLDQSQSLRVSLFRSHPGQLNDLVPQHAAVRTGAELANRTVLHVVLRPRNPEHTPVLQIEEVLEVQISLVKHDNLPLLQRRTDLPCLLAVVKSRRVHHRVRRQHRMQVQVHVALRRRLTAPMLRPVHAVSNELYRCGVHRMNRRVEPTQVAAANPLRAERGDQRRQVFEHPPVKGLRHARVSRAVCIRKRVALRWRRPPYRSQPRSVQLQPITDVIEPHRVGQLPVDVCRRVTPRRELARVDLELPRKLRHQVTRNQLAYLAH